MIRNWKAILKCPKRANRKEAHIEKKGNMSQAKVIAKALEAEFINPEETIFFNSDGNLNEKKTYEALA